MNHNDREIIKMKWNCEFVEMEDIYALFLNEEIHSVYPKRKYSRQEAESEAADTVRQKIKREGAENVTMDFFKLNKL